MPTQSNDMKIAGGIIVAIVLVLLAIGAWFQFRSGSGSPDPIGGARDDKGCLSAAGYAFDEKIGACVRSFELSDQARKAATVAVGATGKSQALTVTKVEPSGCEGCYAVSLEKGVERTPLYVRLSNWVPIVDK